VWASSCAWTAAFSGEILKSAEAALLGCLESKLPEHCWAFGKFASTQELSRAVPSTEPAVFLPDAVELQKSMAAAPIETHLASATLAALGWLLQGAIKARGRPHLILLAASQFDPSPEMEAQAVCALTSNVAIHAVTFGAPATR